MREKGVEEMRRGWMGKLEPGDQVSCCHAKVGAGSYFCCILHGIQTMDTYHLLINI